VFSLYLSWSTVQTLWCHKDILACCSTGFIIILSVLGIVNVVCLVVPAVACFLILGSLEAITITQWTLWGPDYRMWNRSIIMCTGSYWHQSFWKWVLLSSSAEVSGFFKYELHIKGTVLCYWSSLRCIKICIAICYRGLKFLKQAVVILPLESELK